MRISEYEKIETLPKDANIIMDGENIGTRTMHANNFAKGLVEFLGTNDILGRINFDDLVSTNKVVDEGEILFKDGDVYYKTTLENLYFMMIEKQDNTIPMRRNTFRGKNLGSVVTDEQLHEIGEGTFHDLFIGDYWRIGDQQWRIVDFDYWYGLGESVDKKCWTHHLVIMPDNVIAANSDDSASQNNSIAGGYYGSPIRTIVQRDIKAKVFQTFSENMILVRNAFCINSVVDGRPTGFILTDYSIEIPSEVSIFGKNTLYTQTNYTSMADGDLDHDSRQFALFKVAPKNIIPGKYNPDNGVYEYQFYNYWLRDMAGSATAYVKSGLVPYYIKTNENKGAYFRPVFGLRAPEVS